MASHQDESIYELGGHFDPPPSYAATVSTTGLTKWTATTDDGRVDLNVDSGLYKALAQCVPPAKNHRDPQDRKVRSFSQSPYSHGEITSHGPRTSRLDIPALNIVIQVVGSRGDVQPFIALGTELKQHGHRVRLATHDVFSKFVRDSGLDFYPIGGDPAELMAYMVKNPGLIPSVKSLRSGDIPRKRKMVAEILRGCWQSCLKADPMTNAPFVANAIIANPPSFAHIHCAQALSIPVHLMFTMPWSNTRAFSHPLANIIAKNTMIDPEVINYISYSVVEWMTWQGLGDVINEWRATIDLEPITGSEGPNLANTLQIPFTYCWSPALVPKPTDWPSHIDVCGFFFRNAPTYHPDPDLQVFLDKGPPPVYIGFGSIVLEDPDKLTGMILSAVRTTGIRAIVSKGWSNLGGRGEHQFQDDNVLYIGDCPHEWLFQHVAAVVHHGGAGTTACGLLNGRPTFIVPFFGDQPFWGAMVGAAGAGPLPIYHKSLTCEILIDAFNFCLSPDALSAAHRLAAKMRQESGVATAVQSFYNNLPTEKLACDILPTEAAAWEYKIRKRTLKVSNVAAEILIDKLRIAQGKLEVFELNPIRIEPSRYDPVSGATSAAVTMSKELVNDTINVVRKPMQAYHQSRSGHDAKSTADNNVTTGEPRCPSARDGIKLDESKSQGHRGCMNGVGPAAYKSVSSVGRLTAHITRATYVDVPLAITEGLRSVPKLYGGQVREYGHVTDWKSGFSKAGLHMVFGIADGLFDLYMEPVMGGQREGTLGVVKGVGKGLVSVMTKVSSAALGIVAYPGQGIYRSIRNTSHTTIRRAITLARHEEGQYRVNSLDEPEVKRAAVLAAFESLVQDQRG